VKRDLHPAYGPVAFRDRTTGRVYEIASTLAGDGVRRPTIEIDGREVPVVDVDVTADSHPFWTGRSQTLDSEGRVEAFRRRFGGGPR
jgi:large subunit ribosomal protein L31